jgi:hypothetical protein
MNSEVRGKVFKAEVSTRELKALFFSLELNDEFD